MTRAFRFLLVGFLVIPAGVADVGCSPSPSEGQPNPELKAPDIPPGRGSSGGGLAPDAPKKGKK